MKNLGPLCAPFILLALGANAQDPKSANSRDPWRGFGIGSWVIDSQSFTKDGQTNTEREKKVRTASKNAGEIQLTVRKEGKTPGTFDGAESTQWHVPGYDPALDPKCKVIETSKEDLTIEGKKYACEVKKYEMGEGKDTATVTYWRCKEVKALYRELGVDPRTLAMRSDVLRVDVVYKSKDREEKTSVQVVSFHAERKIGERKIDCVREDVKINGVQGNDKMNGTVIRWLSDEVPGREVALAGEGTVGEKKFKKSLQIEDFNAAKEK